MIIRMFVDVKTKTDTWMLVTTISLLTDILVKFFV